MKNLRKNVTLVNVAPSKHGPRCPSFSFPFFLLASPQVETLCPFLFFSFLAFPCSTTQSSHL